MIELTPMLCCQVIMRDKFITNDFISKGYKVEKVR